MYLAINEYSGLAKYGKPLLAPLFGASTIDGFDATLHQLRSAVENSDPLSDLDWARAAADRNLLGKRSARRRDSGVDARIFRHLFHETRQKARVQSRRGNRAAARPPESYSQP
jgi:hypothetical protein